MRNCITIMCAYIIFACSANTYAYDLFGAEFKLDMVTTSAMKYGVYGTKAIAKTVPFNSEAIKSGFIPGDAIISINGNKISSYEDIAKSLVDGKNIIRLLSSYGFKNLEVYFNKPSTTETATQAANTSRSNDSSLPALKFSDADLEAKYGKSTPESRAADERRRAAVAEQDRLDNARRQQSSQREQIEIQEKQRKLVAEESIKQARVNCSKSSECGQGRECYPNLILHKLTCMSKSEFEDYSYKLRMEQRVDDIETKTNRLDRLRWY